MELKQGKITFLFDHEGASLEIEDGEANVKFVRVRLNQEQVCQMLSRLGSTYCKKVEVFGLNKVGKKHTNKSFEFEVPRGTRWDQKRNEIANKILKNDVSLNGWESDGFFDSQNSFFEKDGKEYARVTIRKWE